MRKPVNQIAGLFLISAVLLGSCLLHPGESYASVRSLELWQTKLQTVAQVVASDYLVEGGQTVLLKDLTETRAVDFLLQTNGQPVKGTVEWSVAPENAVTVEAEASAEATAEGTVVGLTLTPGEVAEDTEATISVSWTAESGMVLKADLKMVVPAKVEESVEPEETEPTESNEPEQTAEEEPEEAPTLSVMEEFAPGSAMVLKIKHPDGCEHILLGLAENAEFPAGTVYSIDYGTSAIVLYDANQLLIQPNSAGETQLLLQLPESMFAENRNPVSIWANVVGQSGETVLTAQMQPVAANLQIAAEDSGFVLTPGDSEQLPLPFTWAGCTLSWTAERLTETENGIVYRTAESTGSLSVSGQNGSIVVSLTDTQMQAGTYRLTLVWRYEIYKVAQKEVVFHINYSDCSSTQTMGGNEQ